MPLNCVFCRFYFEFALANERSVAQEICGEYVDTMSKIYFSYFKSYSSRLMKLQVSNIQFDLLQSNDSFSFKIVFTHKVLNIL